MGVIPLAASRLLQGDGVRFQFSCLRLAFALTLGTLNVNRAGYAASVKSNQSQRGPESSLKRGFIQFRSRLAWFSSPPGGALGVCHE
jgi:hypothetical protein